MATKLYNMMVGAATNYLDSVPVLRRTCHISRINADIGAEFRAFVENTERELFILFQTIDRDEDGRVDKSELRGAFKKAGLSVPASKLDQLFSEVDQNNDVSLSQLPP